MARRSEGNMATWSQGARDMADRTERYVADRRDGYMADGAMVWVNLSDLGARLEFWLRLISHAGLAPELG